MYAYKELKKQLDSVDEFRFIFTSPTFTKEKASKAKREFYIPRLSRETSLYGTEYEIKLRNEMLYIVIDFHRFTHLSRSVSIIRTCCSLLNDFRKIIVHHSNILSS